MNASHRSFALALFLAAFAAAAHGQATSPFAGSWRGTSTSRIEATCTSGGVSASESCVSSTAWTGTVDGTGLFRGLAGPTTVSCAPVPAIYDGTTESLEFQVPPNGVVVDTFAVPGCPMPVTFTTSPSPRVSGASGVCPFNDINPVDGAVCTGTQQFAVTGTGTPLAFPMTVTANIGATVSSASANIQYRPQDVGAAGGVFTFAVAPATITKSADGGEPPLKVGFAKTAGGDKDTSVACVLAQLNSSGQLQAVSASSLQAFVSGVLSSQGQAVTILNGVPTVNIGGAVFYVGYGSSASSMISGNVVNRAVSVPGTTQCNPQPPQTGWWWNPNEGGRGFSIEAQGTNLFMASYLYDVSGRATWYVAAGPTTIEGSLFSGPLLSFGSGVTLSGPYRPNARLPDAGAVTLAFNDAQHGTLVWPGGTVALQRYGFGTNGPETPALAGQPQSGWWWGGAGDNGRGFFIEWQGAHAFIAGYMYDASGNPVWYVADTPAVSNAQTFTGTWLQFANGQTLTGSYRAASLANGNVAPVTIQFQGAENAILTLPSGSLPLTRFRF